MNPAQLLAHFHRVSEAPDAIPRLRRFILDLAVRGKLVEQDSKDEPASELIKRIQAEKARLVKEGKTKKQGMLPPVEPKEVWDVPSSWVFVPLETLTGSTGFFTDGDWVESKDQDQDGDVRLIQLADVGLGVYRNRSSRFMTAASAARLNCTYLNPGDILVARMPDPLGRACIFPGDSKPSVTVVDVAILRLGTRDLDSAYVAHAINSPPFARNVESKAAGTTRSRISRGNLSLISFPLPPLAEQHRIVAKVDELMAVCDRLEEAQAEREQRRDRLAAVSLNRLNNGADAQSFRGHVRFHLRHLPRLTTRPAHIQQLRQTILNLAVRGQLVPQDPNDEPTDSLISRIEDERRRRASAGEPVNTQISANSGDGGFPIPQSWKWGRLGFVTNVLMGQSPPGETYNTHGEGIPLINGPVEFSEGPFGITVLNQYTTAPTKLCKKGDLLLCVRGSTTGRTNVAGCNACIGRGVAALQPLYSDQFVRLFIWLWRDKIIEMGRGIAFPSISRQQIENLPIPLPPLPEQHRIVAKVEELMALCDRLEAQLTTAQTESRRLLETVLYETLAGAT